MNPIEFCQLSGYHSTLFLTFSFDPLFFERLVLPPLRASGSGTVLVIADQGQLASAQASWPGQLVQIGRRYQLFGYQSSGSFHPKLIVRIGSEGGAVWLGSANTTFAGWGVNRELGTAWTFGPGKTGSGSWFSQLLDKLRDQGLSETDHIFMNQVRREAWVQELGHEPPEGTSTLLTTFGGQSLAEQLENRWGDRQFSDVKVLTGSTDIRGAFLRRLHERFGVEKATVIADSGRCSFVSSEISSLPLALTVASPADEMPNPLHAKFYWLDGPDGPAAVYGSANCSAAAWLIGPSEGGNQEAVVVYDDPDPGDYESILHMFDAELPSIFLGSQANDVHEGPRIGAPPVRVLTAGWRDSAGPLVIRFDAHLAEGTGIVALVNDRSLPLRPIGGDRANWVSDGSPNWSAAEAAFAELQISIPGVEPFSISVWINDYADLRQAELGDDVEQTFRNMARAKTTSEQRAILKRLQQVASAILFESDLFSDPQELVARQPRTHSEERGGDNAAPIDPNELVRSIADLKTGGKIAALSSPQGAASLSLLSVMRALYDTGQIDLLEQETDYDDSWDGNDESGSRMGKGPVKREAGSRSPPDLDEAEIDEKFKERLRKQTSEFLEKLGTKEFADNTSATQLVQAAAYPLALAIMSVRDRWAPRETAQVWCQEAFEILLRRQYPGSRVGLLDYVALRYGEESQTEAFEQIVGDGTLWFALLSAIHHFSWEGFGGSIERAFVLRDVFRCESLVASADPGRLSLLIDRGQQLKLQEVLEFAPKIDRLLGELEAHLGGCFDDLVSEQEGLEDDFSAGDLMWRKKIGFGIYTGNRPPNEDTILLYLYQRGCERPVMKGYFANVSLAGLEDTLIAERLAELKALCE